MGKYIEKLYEIKSNLVKYKNRVGLKNKEFTIISNNCWGGFVYQKFGLEYRTPFIGLFIFAPDYIRLLNNLEKIVFYPMRFISPKDSEYVEDILVNDQLPKYPIGVLGDDIEIHFLHYKNEKEALEKWNRRVKRINFDNMLIKLSDKDRCSENIIREFELLKYKNKICFTAKEYENTKYCIQIKECSHLSGVKGEWQYYEKYVDIKNILNNIKIEGK